MSLSLTFWQKLLVLGAEFNAPLSLCIDQIVCNIESFCSILFLLAVGKFYECCIGRIHSPGL